MLMLRRSQKINPQHAAKLAHHWRVSSRLFVSCALSLVLFFLLPNQLSLLTQVLCLWNGGMLSFLLITWLLMLNAPAQTMRRNAQSQDDGRMVILSLITAAACASTLAIVFILKETKGQTFSVFAPHIFLALVTIIGSWLLVHTIFAMHYAHEYYKNHVHQHDLKSQGLDFPESSEPNYWDFLYFSFVIGMTSQVSDVRIISSALRKLALLHGVLSFFFNTLILAMSINIIAGLIQ